MIPKFRTNIELSRKTHSRNQVKELDKNLSTHPQTKPFYTGLVGRKFCFGFDNEAVFNEFQKEAKDMLSKLYNIESI